MATKATAAVDMAALGAIMFARPEWRARAAHEARHRAQRLAQKYGGAWGSARPRFRSDCWGKPRPCPWVSCRHHLLVDVDDESRSLRLNLVRLDAAARQAYKRTFPPKYGRRRFDVWSDVAVQRLYELEDSCSLDVADRGAHTLTEVGTKLSMTREGARLVESDALIKLRDREELL